MRLAMIYALLDGRDIITVDHLESALAFWEYCRDSAKYIFQGRDEDNVTQKILEALKAGPLTATELYGVFNNHIKRIELEGKLQDLISAKKIEEEKTPTDGKPTKIYRLASREVIEI